MCSLTRASRCAHSRVRADVFTHACEPMCSLTGTSRCVHSRVRADVLTHGYEPMCSLTGNMPCGGRAQTEQNSPHHRRHPGLWVWEKRPRPRPVRVRSTSVSLNSIMRPASGPRPVRVHCRFPLCPPAGTAYLWGLWEKRSWAGSTLEIQGGGLGSPSK
eukprot:gene14576-biopygen5127